MVFLDGSTLTIEQLLAVADRGEAIALTDTARARVRASRAVVDRRARGDEPAYGINTGFGSFADVKIAPEALETLQLNLLRSHAAGLGDPLPVRAVRATMALRANVLAKGFSGIGEPALDALIALLNRGVHPRVPSRGSVGASGDLAPLAHLALVLIGEGEVLDDRSAESLALHEGGRAFQASRPISGAEALSRAGLSPIRLGPKEGLALINGTQPSTAVLALALAGAEQVTRAADIAAALSID
ncbi:MAG TPA: aromatic amino acid lyase, partial [Vicinamibacterales bacterium]|nr:aromatic amino acid lyase [Vicinamibacterales bacterium]